MKRQNMLPVPGLSGFPLSLFIDAAVSVCHTIHRRGWLLMVALMLGVAHFGNAQTPVFIRNGSFTNAQYWQTNENDATTTVTLDYNAAGESGLAGDKALRISGNDNAIEGVKQDVIGVLTNSPGYNSRTFVTRFSINPAAPASVRCYLQLKTSPTDSQGPRILAEQVVRSSNQWVRVEGVHTVTWTGALAKAYIYFEVQQYGRGGSLAAVPLPVYSIDNVSMDLDDDGDGLSNAEELLLVPPTLIDNPDSDGDHLPDGWEHAHGTLPMTADADQDSDNDGYSNIEEYFAATDPQNPNSRPGMPSDPAADVYTRAMLRYFALLPSKRYTTPTGLPARHLAVGQMISDALPANSTELNSFSNNITRLSDQVALLTGSALNPAILGLPAEHSSQPIQIQADGILAEPWLKAGGIVQIKFRPWNPWTVTLNGAIGLNVQSLLTNTTDAAYIVFHDWLRQMGDEFVRLKTVCPEAVILFRPFSEMNGNWFWWGQLSAKDYNDLWRHVYNYMTIERDLHHLLWVYESDSSIHAPSGFGSVAVASDYYYPGDDVVDFIGHNFYSDTWDLNFDEQAVYRRYPKPTCVPQAGSASTGNPSFGIHRATGSFDNLTYLQKIEERYPRLCFIIVWNSFGNTTTNQYVNIVDNLNAVSLMTNDAVVTRESLAWKPTGYAFWDVEYQPTLDANGDGVPNYLAYAMGAAGPSADLSSLYPAISANSTTVIQMLPNAIRDDAHYVVKQSNDLSSWNAVAEKMAGGSWTSLVPGYSVAETGGQVSISTAVSTAGFYQLQVLRP